MGSHQHIYYFLLEIGNIVWNDIILTRPFICKQKISLWMNPGAGTRLYQIMEC